MFSLPANWLRLCALQFSSVLCVLDCVDHLTHTLSLRVACTCATRSGSLRSHLCAYTLCSLILHLSRCLCLSTPVLSWKSSSMCSCHLAPLSATIHTIRATHSQHHILFNSYKMVRSPPLCSYLLPYRMQMVLFLQAPCPAHCCHPALPAHKSLRGPPIMSQVMSCRSLKRSRSSHSLSSYSAAASRLLLPSSLSYQCSSHHWMLLCRRPHLVSSFRLCPRRRLNNPFPRYLLTWQCRRPPTVFAPHPRMLPRRRSHTVLFLRMFLRRWVLVLLPRSLLMCSCRLLYAVLCYTMYRSRSSLLDVSTRTIPWTAKTSFVSPRHQYKVHVPCSCRRLDSYKQPRLLILVLHKVCLLSAFPVMPCSFLLVPPVWEHTLYVLLLAPKKVLVPPSREPTILLVLIPVQVSFS